MNLNFYTIASLALVLLLIIFKLVHRSTAEEYASRLMRATLISYNPADPGFEKVSHRKSIVAFCCGVCALGADCILGFPNISGIAWFKASYVFLLVLSTYVLIIQVQKK